FKMVASVILYPVCWLAEGYLVWRLGGPWLLGVFAAPPGPRGVFPVAWGRPAPGGGRRHPGFPPPPPRPDPSPTAAPAPRGALRGAPRRPGVAEATGAGAGAGGVGGPGGAAVKCAPQAVAGLGPRRPRRAEEVLRAAGRRGAGAPPAEAS